jgi:ATP-dependent Clp protease ATP-binding subunit ClpX
MQRVGVRHRRQHPGRTCSFCGKSEEQVNRLIAGPKVSICDACVVICNEIIAAHSSHIPDPRDQEE